MNTTMPQDSHFNKQYQKHLKCLKLGGLQPKTIDAYARAIRRIGNYFDCRIDDLNSGQLLDYFTELLDTHSWSAVKLDLYGLKFFYSGVLNKPWEDIPLIKPPKTSRIPDILSVEQMGQLFAATTTLSYKVFFFTCYSMGLRLGEGIQLTVGDIGVRSIIHKGNVCQACCGCVRRVQPAPGVSRPERSTPERSVQRAPQPRSSERPSSNAGRSAGQQPAQTLRHSLCL